MEPDQKRIQETNILRTGSNMTISDKVELVSRFQRAIRIDHDFGNPQAIEGFYCSPSSANILSSMVDHISANNQCAFTWTGPYGSGKSSLAVFLCALLSKNGQLRKRAFASLEKNTALKIKKQFGDLNWQVIPIVGRRDSPVNVFGETIESLKFGELQSGQRWNDTRVISTLKKMIDRNFEANYGTILFVDEMGKFLESAAHDLLDIYLFQQIAEIACRSNGRFIFIGVLHQAFGEYAVNLNQTDRDEWRKIQGRFVDLTLKVTIDEQIHVLSQAIGSTHQFRMPSKNSKVVADAVAMNRNVDGEELSINLEKCWPLHPVVACLLGPLSQSSFSQNQRSVFSFLSSGEPFGFQDFIRTSSEDELYKPYVLWEYLRANLESSIYASPDGHRWALAVESIDRCEAQGSNAIEIKLLKTIALLDFFRIRSGLVGNFKVLRACMKEYSMTAVRNALTKLQSRSLVIYRKFIDSYSIFEGSDFNIDEAVAASRNQLTEIDFSELKLLAGIQPILAKRHYHECGALRWCDVVFAPLKNVADYVDSFYQTNSTAGLFIVAVPTQNEQTSIGHDLCRKAGRLAKNNDVVIGLSKHSWRVADLYGEFLALRRVSHERPELESDGVARKEIQSRITLLQTNLAIELNRTIDSAVWFLKHRKPQFLRQSDLSLLASKLADQKFNNSPKIHVEILNRNKPSANAVAAQNALLKRMVQNDGEIRLGIEGNPAESGFFTSLLEQTGLYKKTKKNWGFRLPSDNDNDEGYRLKPIFDVVIEHLKCSPDNMANLSSIYEVWRKPPYGVKDGLMPICVVVFILAQKNQIAFYREGVFQIEIKDIDVEFLTKHPENTSIRLIEYTQASSRLLSQLADIAHEFNSSQKIRECTPINVARGLVSIFEDLPDWTVRTNTISSNANNIRTLFKQASDPNRFLFDDLPNSVVDGIDDELNGSNNILNSVRNGLRELVEVYPNMLERLRCNLLKELRVNKSTKLSFESLRERACNVVEVSGDFRIEAFIGRLATYKNTKSDIEGLASLAVGKLPSTWVDTDFDRANLELSKLARSFVQIETFASIKGRTNKRQAWAILLNTNGVSSSLIQEFDISDSEQNDVIELADRVSELLTATSSFDSNVILAALAKVSSEYMDH